MSLVDDNPDLIGSYDGDNLHLPSLQAGLTLTEMLDPAFDHLWLNFDASKYYSVNDQVYNNTVCSDYLSLSISPLSIIHSMNILGEILPDDPEYRGSSLQSADSNKFHDDGIALDVALPPHIAIVHSPEPSAASLPNFITHPLQLHAKYQPGSASTPSSDGEKSLFDFQHDWHSSAPLFQPYVVPTTNPCTSPVYSPPFASQRSSTQLFAYPQQAAYHSQIYATPNDGFSSIAEDRGPKTPLPRNYFEELQLFTSTCNGAAVDLLCIPMPLPHTLCETLDAQKFLSQVSHSDQYPYDHQDTRTWNLPGSGDTGNGHWHIADQVGSHNGYVQPLNCSNSPVQDWSSYYHLPAPAYLLPMSCDTSALTSDSESPPGYESPPLDSSSSLAHRSTRRSKLTTVDTKPYSRKNLISHGMAPLRKANIFNPAQSIHCTLRIERGDKKGQKCNVWCDGVDAFTRHLKEDCHNFSPCKRPPSKSPGSDYAPDDDGLPMEWGFCTWDKDDDCETFKMRRRKNRLGPMSGGDLIRHIREAHAGVPR